jgi:hypothetical protein
MLIRPLTGDRGRKADGRWGSTGIVRVSRLQTVLILSSDSAPLAGRTVAFSIEGTGVRNAITGAAGTVAVS